MIAIDRSQVTAVSASGPAAAPVAVAAGASPLLPDPAASFGLGDGDMTALAILLTQQDQQDRTESRQLEDAAAAAEARQDAQRVQDLRAQADADEAGAIASGVGAIAGGALGVMGEGGAAAGKGVAGAGEALQGAYKGESGRDAAAAAEAQSNAQADERRATRAHDDTQAAAASLDKVEQFLQQTLESQNAARLAAVSVRA